MRKTKTVARQETVECCDLCEREMGSWLPERCFLCGRSACCACRQWVSMTPDDAKHLEMGFKVCKDCLEAGRGLCSESSPDSIRRAVGDCDRLVQQYIGQWRAWAKERAGLFPQEARP